MSKLEIRWPDADAERVRAACGRLAAAAPALRARTLAERLGLVARVIDDWTAADSPWRRELAEVFAATGPFHAGTVREGLDSALQAWRAEDLFAAARRELGPLLDADDAGSAAHARAGCTHRVELTPFEWTAVLAGGTIPMPTLLSSLFPLVLGSPVLLRESAKDAVTGRLLARSLAAHDAVLARAFEPIGLAAEEGDALSLFFSAPCIVATGSDETMRSIGARLQVRQRFVAYGHRVSVVVVGHSQPLDRLELARSIALDVARWDQTGCLSPIAVHLSGWPRTEQEELAHACHEALAALAVEMPRGDPSTASRTLHANERAEARMRAASGRARLFEGGDATVVLEADATPRPAPLFRFLRMHPTESPAALEAALAALGAPLSGVALAGFDSREASEIEARLTRLGASRFAQPGRLQTPPIDWPRDEMPLFASLTRFRSSESIR
ncbi:MAG: acyl-CoA reductase [Myxococcota bacterium]